MINGDAPAMPIPDMGVAIDKNGVRWMSTGLSIRQHFASLAMQGLCASGFATEKSLQKQAESIGSNVSDVMAVFAVDLADALINELNKQPNEKT